MAGKSHDDHLAYGEYHEGQKAQENEADEEHPAGERGFLGDTFRKLRNKYQPDAQGPGYGPNAPPSGGAPQPAPGLGSSLFEKLHGAVHGLGSELTQKISGRPVSDASASVTGGTQDNSQHRYGSFAGQKAGNDVKWYVDGCGYMWAVSRALEQAKESIWILDCKLFPSFMEGVNFMYETSAPKFRHLDRLIYISLHFWVGLILDSSKLLCYLAL